MAQDYVDIALLQIGRADGALVTLDDVVDFETDVDDNSSTKKTMNRKKRARGHVSGVTEVTGSLTVAKRVVPELDWRKMHRNKEIFQIFYDEAEDGQRFHVVDVKISKIGNSASESGDNDMKIEFMALDEIEVPT